MEQQFRLLSGKTQVGKLIQDKKVQLSQAFFKLQQASFMLSFNKFCREGACRIEFDLKTVSAHTAAKSDS